MQFLKCFVYSFFNVISTNRYSHDSIELLGTPLKIGLAVTVLGKGPPALSTFTIKTVLKITLKGKRLPKKSHNYDHICKNAHLELFLQQHFTL